MLQSIEGIYRDGKIELLQKPPDVTQSRVIITFLSSGLVDLRDRGIDEAAALDLRHRLKAFAEDWDRPEMDVYNDR